MSELLDRLETVSDANRRIYILQEVARVCEQEVGDLEMAMTALRAALREDYMHDPVASELERLASVTSSWNRVLPELMAEAEQLQQTDPRAAADLWVRIANWYADPLDRIEYAIASAKQAVEAVPHHAEALATLSALLRSAGDWLGMVDVASRLAAIEADNQTRVDLYLSIAGVCATHLRDDDRAIEANRAALAADPTCVAALQNLETVYRQRGDTHKVLEVLAERVASGPGGDTRLSLQLEMAKIWECELGNRDEAQRVYRGIDAPQTARAVELMKKLAAKSTDPHYQAALHDQIGRFRLHRRSDDAAAEWHLIQALSHDDSYRPAMQTLAELYSKRGDWKKAANMYDRARRYTDKPRDRLALALASARIYLNELKDTDHAAARYADIIAADPEHIEAANALAELYYENECWPELAPILARLRKLADAGRVGLDAQRLYYLSARCASGLGNQSKAYDFYERAYELDPSDMATLRGLADEQFARQNWRRAVSLYEDLLAKPDRLDPDSEVKIATALGVAHSEAGSFERALRSFENVLDKAPRHREALAGVIRCRTATKDWSGVVKAQRKLIDISSGEEKLELLRALGDTCRVKLNNLPAALAAYRAATELYRSDQAALRRTLDVAAKLSQWDVVTEMLDRCAELEPTPAESARYLVAAATVHRDKRRDDMAALRLYARALDVLVDAGQDVSGDDATQMLKAFAEANAIYVRKRMWADQESAYRRMIRRLPAGHRLLAQLWHGLGEVYRTRLRQRSNAITAFEIARDLEPENIERREHLAALYVSAGPDSADKAIAEHQAILDQHPTRYDSYVQLGRILLGLGRYDEAWCVCRALVFLGKASTQARQYFAQYNALGLQRATRRMTPDRWSHIYHPLEDRLISSILSMVWRDVAAIRAQSPRTLGLRKRDLATRAHFKAPRVQLVSYAAQALGLRTPDVYVQHRQHGNVAFASCKQRDGMSPALVLRAHYFSTPDDRVAAFNLGKKMCYLRPDHVLALAYESVAQLQGIFEWAVRRPANEWSAHADAELIDELSRTVTPRVGPSRWEQLQRLVHRERQSKKPRELHSWRVAIDHTADRTGFVLCNDLATAAAQITSEHAWPGMPDPQTRISALLRYSVSTDYFAVRRHLGMVVGPPV